MVENILSDLRDGKRWVGVTDGTVSLFDVLGPTIERLGPCEVDIVTWSMARPEFEALSKSIESGEISRFRIVMGQDKLLRCAISPQDIEARFGKENCRAAKSHAKFSLVRPDNGDPWTFHGSMNLNRNPRSENLSVSPSPSEHERFKAWVDEVFTNYPPGIRLSRSAQEGIRKAREKGESDFARIADAL